MRPLPTPHGVRNLAAPSIVAMRGKGRNLNEDSAILPISVGGGASPVSRYFSHTLWHALPKSADAFAGVWIFSMD